jgi:hypothetical protein
MLRRERKRMVDPIGISVDRHRACKLARERKPRI